jgi:hypothetical protein
LSGDGKDGLVGELLLGKSRENIWKIGSMGGVGGATTWLPFFNIFNSDVFPVEPTIFQETQSREIRRRKIRGLARLDEGDRRWRWTDGIRGASLHVAESGRGPLSPPATVQPSIR